MSYLFLSHILSKTTPSYGNKDSFIIHPNTSISNGDTANTSSWSFTNNHFGTHIDLPFHFDNNGKRFEDYDANSFVFNKVQLIDIPCRKGVLIDIDSYNWASIDSNTELLLIRTGFEQKRGGDEYWKAYPGISVNLCKHWRKKFPKLKCIGFDFISLTSPLYKSDGKAAHLEMLMPDEKQDAIFIIEDMSLELVHNNIQNLIVAPLRVENGNGGPVTVIAKI